MECTQILPFREEIAASISVYVNPGLLLAGMCIMIQNKLTLEMFHNVLFHLIIHHGDIVMSVGGEPQVVTYVSMSA